MDLRVGNATKLDKSTPIDDRSNAKPHVRESYGTTQCAEAPVFSHRGLFFARVRIPASPPAFHLSAPATTRRLVSAVAAPAWRHLTARKVVVQRLFQLPPRKYGPLPGRVQASIKNKIPTAVRNGILIPWFHISVNIAAAVPHCSWTMLPGVWTKLPAAGDQSG